MVILLVVQEVGAGQMTMRLPGKHFLHKGPNGALNKKCLLSYIAAAEVRKANALGIFLKRFQSGVFRVWGILQHLVERQLHFGCLVPSLHTSHL